MKGYRIFRHSLYTYVTPRKLREYVFTFQTLQFNWWSGRYYCQMFYILFLCISVGGKKKTKQKPQNAQTPKSKPGFNPFSNEKLSRKQTHSHIAFWSMVVQNTMQQKLIRCKNIFKEDNNLQVFKNSALAKKKYFSSMTKKIKNTQKKGLKFDFENYQ